LDSAALLVLHFTVKWNATRELKKVTRYLNSYLVDTLSAIEEVYGENEPPFAKRVQAALKGGLHQTLSIIFLVRATDSESEIHVVNTSGPSELLDDRQWLRSEFSDANVKYKTAYERVEDGKVVLEPQQLSESLLKDSLSFLLASVVTFLLAGTGVYVASGYQSNIAVDAYLISAALSLIPWIVMIIFQYVRKRGDFVLKVKQ
jgi:hypothetical protein